MPLAAGSHHTGPIQHSFNGSGLVHISLDLTNPELALQTAAPAERTACIRDTDHMVVATGHGLRDLANIAGERRDHHWLLRLS